MNGETRSGCLILLVDESAAMESQCQDGKANLVGNQTKSKSEAVAAALNALIRQLAAMADFDVALVGYHAEGEGAVTARSAWGGDLAGRDFASLSELAAHPLSVEQRARKIPDPTSLTGFRDEMIDFPVWYKPACGGTAPQIKAFQHCREILTQWQSEHAGATGQPLVLHLFAGGSSDGNPFKTIDELQKLPGNPLVFQAHLCSSEHVPATLYAASRTYVPVGPVRDLFDRCSPLPTHLLSALKSAKIAVGPHARGMVYNGRMTDIVQFLGLAKDHSKSWPSQSTPGQSATVPVEAAVSTADAPSTATATEELPVEATPSASPPAAGSDKAACVLFVLDRSVTDPFGGNTQSSWSRLQEHVNSLLAKIGKAAEGHVETGVVSYGLDTIGEVEVRQSFEGPLSGKTLVTDLELNDGAIRVDEVEQLEPDGIGGLMTISIQKKIYVELEPTLAAPPVPAFEAARDILTEWCGRHPDACTPPIVVHLTRGNLSPEDLASAWEKLDSVTVSTAAGPTLGYHLVATEDPQSSVAFPVDDTGLQNDELKAIFARSGKLLGSESLAVSKPKLVQTESRGLVVNGKFELLLDGIAEAFSRL